ncbi:MAG: hypothetical protein BECKG1743D_GA0114223_103002 [Candidatus Kentron sp. G]|nr:MAG: hypothetical protein BECKG1743F_GA0114225_102592 [Candidatus Kentron sp. G]VFM99830.1 MAG: hypothetical protein BECKG1743E_GA0114224_102852 [Candidatus Kentron sp. G]VFN01673.1 MAG: hypothetical protein BECKG1743D_GA0114223_103002 [Candidatus Kentron sp. G]
MKFIGLFYGVLFLALVVTAPPTQGENAQEPSESELTLEQYIELTIERLELARQSWLGSRQPPSSGAMDWLFSGYGISEQDYLTYTAVYRDAIADYLDNHPYEQRRIDELSTAIDSAIGE